MSDHIGFIGLGAMGLPMVANLAKAERSPAFDARTDEAISSRLTPVRARLSDHASGEDISALGPVGLCQPGAPCRKNSSLIC